MADIAEDMNLFDNIISGDKNAPIEPTVTEVTQPQEPVRDDKGKFAKADEPTTEAPVDSTTQQPNAEPERVPVAAVQDERRKRQEAERRAQALEEQLATLTKTTNVQQPVVQTPQQQSQPVTIWDDPDAWQHQQLAPIQSSVAEVREMMMEMQAMQRHGADVLGAAKEAAQALAGKPEGVALYQEIMSRGGNPFDSLVAWHKQQQVLARVGPDPEAFIAAEREKMLTDPAFLAQALERAKASAASNVNTRSSAPRVSLPSLSNIPATGGGNATAEPASDEALFNSIASARRK
jgi:hypothetical protein